MPPARKRTPKGEADGHAAESASAERSLEQAAQLFDLVAEPTRFRILLLLDQAGEMNVTELHQAFGISQSSASTHLKMLRLGRLIESRQAGRYVKYRLASPAVRDFLRLACRLVETAEG